MGKTANDFVINIATANGTGSQSSNLILMHSMFEMGVPVSGKNLFPSNISGLPTWYIIRASDAGYQAPGDKTDIQVIMNKNTWMEDLEKVESGTIIVYNEDVKLPVERDDCILLGMPMTKMARGINPKLARLMSNMYYVGALAQLLEIEQSAIASAVSMQFKGKEKAIDLNMRAISEGRFYAEENWGFECPPIRQSTRQGPRHIPHRWQRSNGLGCYLRWHQYALMVPDNPLLLSR